MASFGHDYFISQLLEAGALENVSDKRLTRISNISIGLVLAATAIGEFTDNEILQWVRKGRRMTPLIKEQYDMFRDLSQYLMNCVEEDDFESWRELLDSCRYVCPTKKTECSSIFGKVSQFCQEVKSSTHSNEAEEYEDNLVVMKESYPTSNKDISEALNTKEKKDEKLTASKFEQREYLRPVERNEISSEPMQTNQLTSQKEIEPPIEIELGGEKLENKFGKHLSKKKNINPDKENLDTTSVLSTNDECNLNNKVTSLYKELSPIEEPSTSSDYASIDDSNFSHNNEYDSDDSMEEEEMSVEIIDNGIGNIPSVFDTLINKDFNDKKDLDDVDNEIKELAKNVTEKLRDSIYNVSTLRGKDNNQEILSDEGLKTSKSELVKGKKVEKDTTTNKKESIEDKVSDIHEASKKEDTLRQKEQDSKVDNSSDIKDTVKERDISDIIKDKKSSISPCHEPDKVVTSTKVDNELLDDNSHFENLEKQDVGYKGDKQVIDKMEEVIPEKQPANEEVFCENKSDEEGSFDDQSKESIGEEKDEFNDEFLENLLFKEIDTSDTENEMDTSEQTNLKKQAILVDNETPDCKKNLDNDKLETLLCKDKSIQNVNVDQTSISKRHQDVMNISEKGDLSTADISEGPLKGYHRKDGTVKSKFILEEVEEQKDQKNTSNYTVLLENREMNISVSDEEGKNVKLMEYENSNEFEKKMDKTKERNNPLLLNEVGSDGFENKDIKDKGELESDDIMEKMRQVNQLADKEIVDEVVNDSKESKTKETLKNEVKVMTETIKSNLEKAEGRIEILDIPLKKINTYDKDKERNNIEEAVIIENDHDGTKENQKIFEKAKSMNVEDITDKNNDPNPVYSCKEQDGILVFVDSEVTKTGKAQSKELVQSNNENKGNMTQGIKSHHKDKDASNTSVKKIISNEKKLRECIQIDEEKEDIPLMEIDTSDNETNNIQNADLSGNENPDLDNNVKMIEQAESINVESINVEDISDKNEDDNSVYSTKEQDDNIEIIDSKEIEASNTQFNKENRKSKNLGIKHHRKDKDANNTSVEKTLSDESNLEECIQIDEEEEASKTHSNNENMKSHILGIKPSHKDNGASNTSVEKTLSDESNLEECIQIDEDEEDIEILDDEIVQDSQIKSNSNNSINKKNTEKEEENDEISLIIDENIDKCTTEKNDKDEMNVSKDSCPNESSRVEKVVETDEQEQSDVMVVDLSDEDADIEVLEEQVNTIQKVNDKSDNDSNSKAREDSPTHCSTISNEDEITEISNRTIEHTLQVENNDASPKKILNELSQSKTNENSNKENEHRIRKDHMLLKTQKNSNTLPQKKSSALSEEDMAMEVEVEIVNDNQLKQIHEGDVVGNEERSTTKDKTIVSGCDNTILNTTSEDSLPNENVIEIIDSDNENEDDQIDKEKKEKINEKGNDKEKELNIRENEESQGTPSIEEVIEQTKRLLEREELYKAKEKAKKKRIEKGTEMEALERKKEKLITKGLTTIIDVNVEQDSNQKNMFVKDDSVGKEQENKEKNVLEADKTRQKVLNEKVSEVVTEVEVLKRTDELAANVPNVEDAEEINQINMLKIDEVKGKHIKGKDIEKETEADNFENQEKHIKTSLTKRIDIDDEHENNLQEMLRKEKSNEKDKGKEKILQKRNNDEKHIKSTVTENLDITDYYAVNEENTTEIDSANSKDLDKESIKDDQESDVLKRKQKQIETNLTDVNEVDLMDYSLSCSLSKEKVNTDVIDEQKSVQLKNIQNMVNDDINIELDQDKDQEIQEESRPKEDSENDSDIYTKDITEPFLLEVTASKYEKVKASGEEELNDSSEEKHETPNKAISLPIQYNSVTKSLPLNEDFVYSKSKYNEGKNSYKKSSLTNVETDLPKNQLSSEEIKNSSEDRTEMQLAEESILRKDNVQIDNKRKSLEIAVSGRKKPKLVKNFGSNQNNEVEFKNLNRKNGLDILIPIIKNCGGTFLVRNGKIVYSFPSPERASSIVKVLNEFRFPDKHLEVCLVDSTKNKEDCDDQDFVKNLIDKEVRRNEDLFTIFIKYLLKNSIALKDCEFYSSCWQDVYVQDLIKSFQYFQKAVNSLLHINTGPSGVYILVVSPSSHVLQWLMSAISKDLMLVKSCKRDSAMAAEIVTEDSHATGSKILLSTPEEAVELLLDSNNVSETLSALILDDASRLMDKHYMAMRRLANLFTFTKRQTQRGLNIVAVTEEVVEENVKTLSQIFNSTFIIHDGNSTGLNKKTTSQMPDKEDKKEENTSRVKNYLKCLSSNIEKDKYQQQASNQIESYDKNDIGRSFQRSKEEGMFPSTSQTNQKYRHQAQDSNVHSSSSEEFRVTSESSEVVSSTEIITQQIITKKTIVNTVNKQYTYGKNEDFSSHMRKDHSDSGSDITYDQNYQNQNRFENDRSSDSWIPPNKNQNIWNYDSRNTSEERSSSSRSSNTDRSVWRSGAITADAIKNKPRRDSSELLISSRSNSLENLASHSQHDHINKKSNTLDQQNLSYKHSGSRPSTSNMEIASKSSREIVPNDRFRKIIDPFREGRSDSNHFEHTQSRNDSFRSNRYESARNADPYDQYDDSRSGRSLERSSDYSRNSTWRTQNVHLQGGSRTSNISSSERGGSEFYNQQAAGRVGPSADTDLRHPQRPYHDAAGRFNPYVRQSRDRDSFHSGPHGPRDRDTFHSGQYGPRDRDTFDRGSYNQRFNSSSDSDHRDRRRNQSGGYWK